MDVHGNRELIYEGVYNTWYAIPIRARAARITTGSLAGRRTGSAAQPARPHADVYEGVPDLPRGRVKHLRDPARRQNLFDLVQDIPARRARRSR